MSSARDAIRRAREKVEHNHRKLDEMTEEIRILRQQFRCFQNVRGLFGFSRAKWVNLYLPQSHLEFRVLQKLHDKIAQASVLRKQIAHSKAQLRRVESQLAQVRNAFGSSNPSLDIKEDIKSR